MILFRYLCKELYVNLLAIVLILLIIFMTNEFIVLLQKAGNGQLSMLAVLKVMSLQLPLMLGYLIPLGLYLSVLLVFGRLYMDHEMAVLSACGVSKAKLLSMVMIFSIAVMVVVAWLMLWVEPLMEKYQFKVLADSVASASIAKIAPQRFQSLGKAGVFYAGQVSHVKGELKDVFLALKQKARAGQPTTWDVTVSNTATEHGVPNQSGNYLTFHHGDRYVGAPGSAHYQDMQFSNYGLRLLSAVPHIGGGYLTHPTSELWRARHTNPQALAILQWRIALPLSILIFPLIAFPLSQVNPRRGRFMQLLPAILIYVVYADLLFLGRAWMQNGTLSPTVGLWPMHAGLLLVGLLLIMHRTGWKRLYRMIMTRGRQHASA